MKIYLSLLLFVFRVFSLFSRISLKGYNQERIDPPLFEGQWKVRWISYPGETPNVCGAYRFRKSFDLEVVPSRLTVHVSADNRYKLYVNGKLVSLGPAREDIYNWSFETVDLAPYLRKGKNTLASVVWNYAERKPVVQISYDQTGPILQGNTGHEAVVNTDITWACLRNKACAPWTEQQVLGYYVAGPDEKLEASAYPRDREQPGYDDGKWKKATRGTEGATRGSRDYPGRLPVPSPIFPMNSRIERLVKLRQSEGIECPQGFSYWLKALMIPTNTEVRLFLDNDYLTMGYFSLAFSKGKEAEIHIGYSEALYKQEEGSTTKSYTLSGKGHRDELTDKQLTGCGGKILADGGDNRLFTSLWWRTWRYVESKVETASEPLVIEDIYGTFSAYPFRNETTLSAPGYEELGRMFETGWRIACLCADETYVDCPYYEQP